MLDWLAKSLAMVNSSISGQCESSAAYFISTRQVALSPLAARNRHGFEGVVLTLDYPWFCGRLPVA